jgi:hypothetical protein
LYSIGTTVPDASPSTTSIFAVMPNVSEESQSDRAS